MLDVLFAILRFANEIEQSQIFLLRFHCAITLFHACRSSTSDASYVTKPESIASTKRASDVDSTFFFTLSVFNSCVQILLRKSIYHDQIYLMTFIYIVRPLKTIQCFQTLQRYR